MGKYRKFSKSSTSRDEYYDGKHRFEHWYIDNQVYFITARCRDGYPAFQSQEARSIFWDRFNHWTQEYEFTPWVTSLMNNHYHTEGYLKIGRNLGPMMQKIHGSVAKLVNDLLPERLAPFWWNTGRQGYFMDASWTFFKRTGRMDTRSGKAFGRGWRGIGASIRTHG